MTKRKLVHKTSFSFSSITGRQNALLSFIVFVVVRENREVDAALFSELYRKLAAKVRLSVH